MNKDEIIKKITQKREFSLLPPKDIEMAFAQFDKEKYSDEEKVKLTRDFLRKAFSGFSGKKMLLFKEKSAEEVLNKHLSTRERYPHYKEIYERLLKNLPAKISIVDMGAGTNGFSYSFFNDTGKEVDYLGIEAIGQFVDLGNAYFDNNKINGKMVHLSLFELEKVKQEIRSMPKPRIIFLFKVIDSLEKFERDYTKKLLNEIVPLADRIVISLATESWVRRKKFYANRKWLTDFIKENWNFSDDFEVHGERYLVFSK